MTERRLEGVRVAVLERRHPRGHRGALVGDLLSELERAGARAVIVHPDERHHRLDVRPPWDVAVLKSGTAAALHLAAAAEAWGIACINRSQPTRVAQDRLSSMLLLQSAGLPVPTSWAGWSDGERIDRASDPPLPDALVVKAHRGSRGTGVWRVPRRRLDTTMARLPTGAYLFMTDVPHVGDDLKVYAAGEWLRAIERPYPARSYAQKLGRPVDVPTEVAAAVRRVGELLGLTCYGCDFIRGEQGWQLVDVNAFPGYKGVAGAALAIVAEIARAAS